MAYQDEVLADGPISYWRLEETSGTTLDDEVGTNDATAAGGIDLNVISPFGTGLGSAASLDGVDDEISAAGSDFNFGNADDFSVELWVRIDDTSPDFVGVVDKTGLSSSNSQWALEYDGSTAQRLRFLTAGGNHLDWSAGAQAAVEAGVHLVAVMDRAAGVKRLYADGTEVATQAIGTTTMSANGLDLFVGSGGGFGFGDMIVDEVAIYDFALSPTRVQAHFDARDDSAGDAETVTDQAGIADIVTVLLDVREATLTDGLGITDADTDYTVDTDSDDTDPVGLTDTVLAQITGIGGVPARGPITIRPLGRVTVR